MSKKQNLYLGQAGQAFAMSEFLKRGYNVAIPQVDVGDDIFVLEDEAGLFQRIQVKTSKATKRNSGFSVQFNLSFAQLEKVATPELFYIFITDLDMSWQPTLIISRQTLFDYFSDYQIGSKSKDRILLYFSYKNDAQKVTCSNIDFTPFLENWEDFPMIFH